MPEEEKKDNDEMETMEFKAEKIQFFPDDVEKMKSMSVDAQIDYAIKLREEGRYTIVYE